MAITYGFFNAIKQSDGTYDRVYNSDQISEMFEGLISDGVFESVGDALIVKEKSGMTIEVGTGRAWIGDRWMKNDAKMNITLTGAHLTLNRWSAIVIRADYSNRVISIVEKVGTPATTPMKPTITYNDFVKEKCLAYIYVGKGATSITQANIVDCRADTSICGWVTGVIKQVDTSQLFLQYQTAYEQQLANMQAWQAEQELAFSTWFSALTDQLQVNTYIQKYHKVVETTNEQGIFPLDMDGYTYSDTDVILVNVNGISLVEEHEWLLDMSKTPVEIHTSQGIDADNLVEITVLKSKIGQS